MVRARRPPETASDRRPSSCTPPVPSQWCYHIDRRGPEAPQRRRQEAGLHDPAGGSHTTRSPSVTRVTFASGSGASIGSRGRAVLFDNPGVDPTTSGGRAAALLLWAFYLGAQLGSEPPERGLVATATQASCEAARTGVAELARASGTTVELGACGELSPDDFRRHRSHGTWSGTASPPNQDRGSRGAARGAPAARPPSNVRCLSRDSCAEQF